MNDSSMAAATAPDPLAHHLPIGEETVVVDPKKDPEVDLPGDPGGGARSLPWSRDTAGAWQAARLPEEVEADRHRCFQTWLDELREDRPLVAEIRHCRAREQAIRERRQSPRRELPADVDPEDLAQAGWGVVFPERMRPGVREALRPLLDLRRRQARGLYRELSYRPGESGAHFLEHRYGEAPGVIDPRRVPWYLLLVGDPTEIPFQVQYHLQIGHAVGRLCFDSMAEWQASIAGLCSGAPAVPAAGRRLALFAVEQENDLATERLGRHLIAPLVREGGRGAFADWEVAVWGRERAFKADLARLLGSGEETPGVLLAACHGAQVPSGHPEQEELQGADLEAVIWPEGREGAAAGSAA